MAYNYLNKVGLTNLWGNIKAYITSKLSSKAEDNSVVHLTGNESINGRKYFDSTGGYYSIVNRESSYATGDTPTSNVYKAYPFVDKNNANLGILQYASRTTGVRDLSLFIYTNDGSTAYGVQINTNREFTPITNNTYSLGTSSKSWNSCYATTFYGNLSGNATSATTATNATKATQDASGNVITSTYQTKLSTAQLAAANSGVTSTKVTTYDAYAAAIGTKANSSDLTSHTTNNNIHVTSSDKSNWNNKSNFSGSYTDLTNKPTIPTVNNATLTIQKNGTTVKTFSANASANTTANITVPTKTSDLTNDSDYATRTNVANSLQEAKNHTGSAVANCVNLTGTQTITGAKSFTSNVINKIATYAVTDTPTSNTYKQYLFLDKNDTSLGFLQYASRTTGVRDLALYVNDKDRNVRGIQINTNKEVKPIANNSYSLGSSDAYWKNVYATNFTGNLSGNATSSTKATQDANGNNIATTYATKAENSLKANNADAVLKANTEYIFRNYDLNSLNIDEKYNENYVVGISEDGHGTLPIVGWTNIINFCTHHLMTQLCTPIYPNKDTDCMYIRTRWFNDTTWGEWRKSANDNLVVHKSGNETINGNKTFTNSIISANITLSDANFLRCTYGSYGTFWRQDGNNLYLMLTNKNDQYGHWNSFRPIQVSLSTGVCNINGNAATASALASGGIGSSVTYYFIGSTDNPITNSDSWREYGKPSSVIAPARSISFSYTPTVGAIYSGAYLTNVLSGSGSMTNTILKQSQGGHMLAADQKMSASVRGTRISSSQKFLCTTANTSTCTVTCASVSYTTTGTYTVTGTSSVSGSKSSFMRIQ